MLKRCSRSTALSVILTPENAENMLKALSGAGTSLGLHCIEDMRVTALDTVCSYSSAVARSAAVHDAFSALALACKNTQVCGMLMVRPRQEVLHPLP